ncbi:hypothetical protein PybrP1_012841 [[Pythium] brassicae (nom. inval.)]|nr:hypothetical protein PybrP1_012841 [[Pythium] brassicae (nom. inval.)]
MRDDERPTSATARAYVNESLRRTSLYGVSSPKRLPRVRLQSADARVRRDVAAVLLAADSGASQPLVDELRDHKHHEDLGLRPPMDQIQRLHDLFTTVPKDLGDTDEHYATRGGAKKHEWRVGYKNNAHGASHGPLDGLFEPFDAVRDAQLLLARADQPHATPSHSAAIAYPTPHLSPAEVAAGMQPFDEDAAREAMERRMSVQCNQESAGDAHWCPASFSSIRQKGKPKRSGSSGSLARTTAGSQHFPVRSVPGVGDPNALPPRARKAPLAADDRCVQQKQSLLAKAAASYARIRQRVDRAKDPKLRYALPIEDPSKTRAYRLGLEPAPSSVDAAAAGGSNSASSHNADAPLPPSCSPSATPSRERLRFRPRSAAGVNVPFRSLSSPSSSQRSLNSGGASSLEPALSVSKVAGAKRRPRSASVCYLSSSTVYCVDAPATDSRQPQLSGSDFDSVLDRERNKRRCNQSQSLALLARKGMFHTLPVPQIFARLRRESLKNLARRLQRAHYEKLTMDEYMSSCGLVALASGERKASGFQLDPAAQPVGGEEARDSPTGAPASAEATTSSSLLAMRRVLVVTRQQFHIALEAFSLAPADVNLLFSALDVGVEDRVALWEVLRAVEALQENHAELRRARVQVQLARDLPTDLDLLRQSFRIPPETDD